MSVAQKWMEEPEDEEVEREDPDRFSLRLCVPGGMLSADQLALLRDVARQHGLGFIQLTNRQTLEIPGVHLNALAVVQSILAASGMAAGNPGAKVRNVVSCAGGEKCAHAFLDSGQLGRSLDLLLGGEEISVQVRAAVAGCSNCCTAPQMADIGFVGTVEPVLDRTACNGCGRCAESCDERALTMRRGLPRRDPQRCDYCGACVVACPLHSLRPGRLGYTVFVGGKMGRRPQIGLPLARFVPEEEAPEMAARILAFLRDHGQPRERLHSLVRRLGIEPLRAFVHSRPMHRALLREV